MKKYEVLQDFKGSPDGHTVIQFTKGMEDVDHAVLGDDLAIVAIDEKWIKLSKAAEKEAKAKAKAEAERIEAKAKAKAEAERIEAEAKAKAKAEAERAAAIEALQSEIAKLEADGAAALEADATGATAAPIKEQWQAKQNELAALLQ